MQILHYAASLNRAVLVHNRNVRVGWAMGTLEALGMFGGQTVTQTVGASVLFCIATTVYALIWARWFKRGPIEAAMRKIAG